MLLSINVVFLENEPLSCLEWLSELQQSNNRLLKLNILQDLNP